MSSRAIVIVFVSLLSSIARGQVVVELVPDHPGPYHGGESLTVEVWLHSEVSYDAYLWLVQLDFSDSDQTLVLDSTFTFDLSSSVVPEDFQVHPELPIPWTANGLEYFCPPCRLPLPEGGSLQIGSLGLTLATEPGTYRLDALNADDPDPAHGARIVENDTCCWRAFTGEITGGALDLVVEPPPIPVVSDWGLITFGSALILLASIVLGTPRHVS